MNGEEMITEISGLPLTAEYAAFGRDEGVSLCIRVAASRLLRFLVCGVVAQA